MSRLLPLSALLLLLGASPVIAADQASEKEAAEKEAAEKAAPGTAEEAAAADAESEAAGSGEQAAAPCDGGVIFDDGGAEIGYSFVHSSKWGVWAQRFEAKLFPSREIEEVCVCLRRGGTAEELDFEIVFYEVNAGRPAEEPYASVPGQAAGIPMKGDQQGRFYSFETRIDGAEAGSKTGVPIRGEAIYIGIRYDPSSAPRVAICADKSEASQKVLGAQRDDRSKAWDNLLDSRDWLFDDHKALMIRARAKAPAETPTETPAPSGEKTSDGE